MARIFVFSVCALQPWVKRGYTVLRPAGQASIRSELKSFLVLFFVFVFFFFSQVTTGLEEAVVHRRELSVIAFPLPSTDTHTLPFKAPVCTSFPKYYPSGMKFFTHKISSAEPHFFFPKESLRKQILSYLRELIHTFFKPR